MPLNAIRDMFTLQFPAQNKIDVKSPAFVKTVQIFESISVRSPSLHYV